MSATSLSFGSQVINTTSPPLSIMLSNYGTKTLNITGITATANFGETDDCSSSLSSGAGCAINVTFTPRSTGSISGTLSVTDNAAGDLQKVALSGVVNGGTLTGLTGYCLAQDISACDRCVSGSSPSACPPGKPAINPGTTVCQGLSGFCTRSFTVDNARSCAFQNYNGEFFRGICLYKLQ